MRLATMAGTPVLLVSWASWCVDCAAELKGIGDYLASHSIAPVQVILVNVEDPNGMSASRQTRQQDALTTPMWIDDGNAFARAFSTVGVPTAVLLTRSGRRVATFPGALDLSSSQVQDALHSVG